MNCKFSIASRVCIFLLSCKGVSQYSILIQTRARALAPTLPPACGLNSGLPCTSVLVCALLGDRCVVLGTCMATACTSVPQHASARALARLGVCVCVRARPCAFSARCVSAPRAPASASFPLFLPLGTRSGRCGCGLPARIPRRGRAHARRPGSPAGAPHASCPPPLTGAAHSHTPLNYTSKWLFPTVLQMRTTGSLRLSLSRPRRDSNARRRPCGHQRRPANSPRPDSEPVICFSSESHAADEYVGSTKRIICFPSESHAAVAIIIFECFIHHTQWDRENKCEISAN